MRRVAFYTLGCKMNFHETAYMEEQFAKNGYEVVPFDREADVYVVNTCTVTSNADSKCRQVLRRARRKNPDAFVVAVGCLCEAYPEQLESMDEVDLILGNVEKFNVVNFVEAGRRGTFVKGIWNERKFHRIPVSSYSGRARAFLKVQQGCELFCSYCIIPRVRGKIVSEEPDFVIKEVERLVSEGYKEIVLTGTQLGGYGKDFRDGTNLSSLLRKVVDVEGLVRIRLSSIEPIAFDEELIDLVTSTEKIAPHLHIPLQSGSSKVLSLMRRNYTSKDYESLILTIFEKRPDICIGTDVMVGFPGEGENEFKETYDLIERLPIAYLHVFPYSPRKGTVSFGMKDNIPCNVKKERAKALRELGEEKNLRYRLNFVGKERSSIVLKSKGERTTVLTDNYIKVNVCESHFELREELKVKIVKVGMKREDNAGEVVSEAVLCNGSS